MVKSNNKQVKTKERVANHGEVFTNEREVNAMLDLVKDETERIDSRFLEPACGEGNFLAAILQRKLYVVKAQYGKYLPDYEKYSILAISSIYGVELLEDNTKLCRERLFKIWSDNYRNTMKDEINEDSIRSAEYIISKNILCGDALTMLDQKDNPIIFPQWDLVVGNMIKRRDYRLDGLLQEESPNIVETNQVSFSNMNEKWEFDEKTNIKLPSPLKEYKLIDYRRVFEYD